MLTRGTDTRNQSLEVIAVYSNYIKSHLHMNNDTRGQERRLQATEICRATSHMIYFIGPHPE